MGLFKTLQVEGSDISGSMSKLELPIELVVLQGLQVAVKLEVDCCGDISGTDRSDSGVLIVGLSHKMVSFTNTHFAHWLQ